MGKSTHVNITLNSIEGLPDVKTAGQIQIRYGKYSVLTSVKSPLRMGHSSDILESFTFPVQGPGLQFDVYHVTGCSHPVICSGGFVMSAKAGYSYEGAVPLLDKTNGRCIDPKIYIAVTVI